MKEISKKISKVISMATVYTRFGCELTFANLDSAKARGYAAVEDVIVQGARSRNSQKPAPCQMCYTK